MRAFFKATTIALLILLVLRASPLRAAEQQPPVQIAAELGFANLYQPDKPFPFSVDLSEARSPVEGRLRVTATSMQGGDTTYELPMSLSPGSHKRWQLTLPPISGNSVKVQVVDRVGRVLNEQDFFGVQVSPRSSLVVVVQDQRGGHFVLPRSSNEEAGTGVRTANLLPEFLPEDPLAYASVAAILWRSDDPKALTPEQGQALLHWLKLGGLFVVAGGRAAPPELPREFQWPAHWEELRLLPLAKFAGASLVRPQRPLTLLARNGAVGWDKPIVPAATIAVRPLAGKELQTRLHVGDERLASEAIVGGGVLMQLAFDPADVTAQGLTLGSDFWEQLLCLPEPRRPQWGALTWLASLGQDNNHVRLAQEARYTVASVWQIGWVFGAFFALFFVVNFALFRKSRRYEWAWLILIVASIGLFLYNRAFGRVGGFGPTRQIELVRSCGVAGEKAVVHFTHTGLLAPRTRQELMAGTQPHQILLGFDEVSRVVQVLPERQVFPARINAGAFATCASVSLGNLPGDGIAFRWSRNNGTLRLMLKNKTGLNLERPRFHPINPYPGVSFEEDGDEFVMTIPAATFDNWVRDGLGKATEPDPSSQYRRGFRDSSPVADPDESYTGPLEFRFELPETKVSPITSSGAREVKCMRSLRLLIPVPVGPAL